MCSILLNRTVNEQLQQLDSEYEKWCKRIAEFAKAANTTDRGPFDAHEGALRHMPDDLKSIRHYDLGRHRIYLTGAHQSCCYQAWFVKLYKDDGKLVEGTKKFDNMLRKAMNTETDLMIDPDTFAVVPHVIEGNAPRNVR